MLVDRCPRLECLKLAHGEAFNITPLARRGRWPHLRNLTLGGRDDFNFVVVDDPILSAFLKAHPQLERLYINCEIKAFPVHQLLDLRALHFGSRTELNRNERLTFCNGLEYLAVDFAHYPDGRSPFFEPHPSIRTFVITPLDSMKLIDFIITCLSFFPNLEKLHWNHKMPTNDVRTVVLPPIRHLVSHYICLHR
jgi:hypothetical protein